MTSPVTKAMIESYALMVMVMGTFFIYFCGMVWAFCNPKLSGAEEESGSSKQTVGHAGDCWLCAPSPPERHPRCTCAHLPPPLFTAEGLALSTYVKVWDDTDSLLSDCTAIGRLDHGVYNHRGYSASWMA